MVVYTSEELPRTYMYEVISFKCPKVLYRILLVLKHPRRVAQLDFQ